MIKPRLSPQQSAVVSHVEGPLLLVAGQGTGKTRVLTERIRSLLANVPGHFDILALTYTDKAADDMRARLADLGNDLNHVFIGSMHGFCRDMLATKGKLVGVVGSPRIFEHVNDRKEVLLTAAREDFLLSKELDRLDANARSKRLDAWLQTISRIKSHPITNAVLDDGLDKRVVEAYDAGMRASGAYDFDDLLLLAYRLLSGFPKVADLYRRIYRFICIDEAQDLGEAQYAVICALCGESFKNIMMAGDPRQSIVGSNTPERPVMSQFLADFKAKEVQLTENFRYSQAIVDLARGLEPKYMAGAQLPISGSVSLLIGDDEADEAHKVVGEVERLLKAGHPDVEDPIKPSSCAILGNTRFALQGIAQKLKERGIPYRYRLTIDYETESATVDEFQLGLRIMANPSDSLHLGALSKKWKVMAAFEDMGPVATLCSMAKLSPEPRAAAVADALKAVAGSTARLDLMPGLDVLKKYADTLEDGPRRAIHDDASVFAHEWIQYQTSNGSPTIAGFINGNALGSAQKPPHDEVSLLTIHASRGLEFDLVFVVGMAGRFPVFRAKSNQREADEELRNAFAATTRSRRLLYFSYPRYRMTPWGELALQLPPRFLAEMAKAQRQLAPMAEAQRRIEEARQSGAKELDLSYLGLESLPPTLGNLTNLEALYLDGNPLKELPDWLAHLRNLRMLFLGDSELRALPAWVGGIQQLHHWSRIDQQTLYGRDALLKQCQQHLQKKSIFLLYGMSGNGKTALILELEQRAPLHGKEGLRIVARIGTTADDLFQDLAPLLGDRSDFPRAPGGDAKTIAAELLTRYKKPAPAWLWIDRAHCLLDQNGFRQAPLRQLLLGLNLAYGADFVIVMELRERPPLGFLREHAESCEVPGLDRASMGDFLAASAPEGADWRYGGDQLRRVYNWLGAGNGKQANPLTIRLLIEVARGHAETPVQTLDRHSADLSRKIDEQLLDDLIGKLLNREERGLIEALAMYRTAIPHDHVEMLENKLQLPNGWAGLGRRCLVATNNKQNEYYLHGFIASWLLTRLGYQEQGDEEQGQFQPGADAAQREYAENKHAAIAACWLHQLAGSKRKTRLTIERALEAFHHLVAARQADRVAEVAVELLTGRHEWALQRIKVLTDYLHKSGAPVKLLRQALQYWVALDPDAHMAYRFLGECWAKEEGRASPKALACFENACRLLPSYPKYWANLGRCLLAQGVDGARDFLRRIPGVERAHPEALDDYVEAIRADCLKLCGDDEQASALRMKKIDEGSGNAIFYADEARARLAKHDIDGAIGILTLADTRGCADDVTVAVLSGALERAGRGGEAAALREKQMVGGSRNPAFYSDAAQARLLAGDADGALAILDLAEKNQCGNDFTLAIRATVLERAGRGGEAEALRESRMAGGSRHPAFYADAAQARLLAGDADGALAILDLAEKNHAGDDFTLAIRATVLERAGRGGEAAALREKLMAGGSRNPAFYNDAAQARLLAGDGKGALAILDLAQANGCANPITERIRARALRA